MLFDRIYRLLIGQGSQGLEITSLHIQFDIEKTAKKNPNKSTVKVWNLSKQTRTQLEKPDTRCILYAGYKDDLGAILIFKGTVTDAWSKVEGPDIITEFELGDGSKEIRDTTISKGYSKNVKSKTILTDVAKEMGMSLVLPSNAPEREWQHGFSYYGSASKLLDKVVSATGLEWSIQNGDLQVIQKGMVTTKQGIELAVDSGLIYSPERIRASKKEVRKKPNTQELETGKQGVEGWRVQTLLMPMLNPGDRVKLKSKFVEGVFRVEEIRHTGDNMAGEWKSELKLVDAAQPIAGQTATKGGASKGPVSKTTSKSTSKGTTGGDDSWDISGSVDSGRVPIAS